MAPVHVGILAFQGDVEEHEAAFSRLGVKAIRVLVPDQLTSLTHLVIPGGESTVMSLFLKDSEMKNEIINRVKSEKLSVFGTCAGAILLSESVVPAEKVENMDLIDVDVNRNAYGSQLHSFEQKVEFLPSREKIQATFIRAPKFTRVGEGVEILAYHENEPILVRQKNVLTATFHPEYLAKPIVHEYFLRNCIGSR